MLSPTRPASPAPSFSLSPPPQGPHARSSTSATSTAATTIAGTTDSGAATTNGHWPDIADFLGTDLFAPGPRGGPSAAADVFSSAPAPGGGLTTDELMALLDEGSVADDIQHGLDKLGTALGRVEASLARNRTPGQATLRDVQTARDALLVEIARALEPATRRAGRIAPVLEDFLRTSAQLPTTPWTDPSLRADLHRRVEQLRGVMGDLSARLAPHTVVHLDSVMPRSPQAVPTRTATMAELTDTVLAVQRSDDGSNARHQLEAALVARGLHCEGANLLPCIALHWPEEYPQFPGLQHLVPAIVAAHQRDPAVLTDRQRFSDTLLQIAGPGAAGQSLLAFVSRYRPFLVPYLIYRCTGTMPSISEVRALNRGTGRDTVGGFAAAIAPHTGALLGYMDLWRQRGFPAHWSEVQGFLAQRGADFSRQQIEELPTVMPTLERSSGWLYPVGEKPSRLREFMPTLPLTMHLRGDPPDVDAVAAGAAAPARTGLGHALLLHHPGGCTTEQAHEALKRSSPGLRKSERQSLLRALIQSKALLPIGNQTWCVNPDIVNAGARRRILDNAPPGTVWPQNPPRRVRAVEPARAAPAATHPRRQAPAAPPLRDEDIFEAMSALVAADALAPFVGTSPDGLPCFRFPELTEHIRQQHPQATQTQVRQLLHRIPPAGLAAVTQARQWARPRIRADQLDAVFATLHAELPWFYCLPDKELATLVNDRSPGTYCNADTLQQYLAGQPVDHDAAQARIDELMRDGRITLFYRTIVARGLHPASLRRYLLTHGIGSSPADMDRYLSRWVLDDPASVAQSFLPSRYFSNHEEVRRSAAKVMRQLNIVPGYPSPSWPQFLAAFEAVFRHPSGPATAGAATAVRTTRPQQPAEKPRYTGTDTTRVYLAMQEMLSGRAPPLAAQVRASPTAPPPLTGNRIWSDFTWPTRVVALHGGGATGGLVRLDTALSNLMQDPGYSVTPAASMHRGAGIGDALRLPTSHGRQRTTPDDQPWQRLALDRAQLDAVGPALFAQLDAAVLLASDPASGAPGDFIALRRTGSTLYAMDGQRSDPVAVTPANARALMAGADGQFHAALPAVACRGLVGRLVSYRGIDGFDAACAAVQRALGIPLPLDRFSQWLDDRLALPPQLDHAARDRARRAAYPRIETDQVNTFVHSLVTGR